MLMLLIIMFVKICQGGEVPKSYYLSEANSVADFMETAQVAKGDKLVVEFSVEKPGSILRYVQLLWSTESLIRF